MRCRGLFQEVCFVITESSFSASEKVSLECCLLDGGAQIATSIKDTSLTHIICTSNKYNKFISIRNERFVAIVTKEWVFKSFLSQALLPIDRFSANPSMFFSSLVIAPGKVEKDPRKVIDGLITHFGGKVVDGEELYQAATHILCSDKSTISNIKVKHHAFFAHTWKETEVLKECMSWREILRDKNIPSDFMISSATLSFLGSNAGIGIQYHVTYGWLEECVRKKNRVDEKPFVTLEKKNMTPDTPVQYVAVDKLGLQNIVNVYEGAKESLELALMKKISISVSCVNMHIIELPKTFNNIISLYFSVEIHIFFIITLSRCSIWCHRLARATHTSSTKTESDRNVKTSSSKSCKCANGAIISGNCSKSCS
jgi:hypothetical protein